MSGIRYRLRIVSITMLYNSSILGFMLRIRSWILKFRERMSNV